MINKTNELLFANNVLPYNILDILSINIGSSYLKFKLLL